MSDFIARAILHIEGDTFEEAIENYIAENDVATAFEDITDSDQTRGMSVTWLLIVRHPDYSNEHHIVHEGDEPGVRILEIDTGVEFSNGRPSRYWAAQCFFQDTDDTPDMPREVKRATTSTRRGRTPGRC
jgi:hypothetical protein